MSSDEVAAAAPHAPDLAIRARALSKAYRVYARPQDRLRQMLWPRGRRYREFHAVQHVDLEIGRGETVGIVGRNGSGKSTLLRMIAGTLEPTSGELEVDGHVAPLLALGAGFNPEFTGRENVFMNAAIVGLSDEAIRERLESVIAFAELGDFFDQPVRSYSSGMYSRLAFAVAINADPDILVVDEVLAVGDEAFNRKCFARIEEIKQAGSTILFASHSAQSVIELCDRAILIERGERLLSADPKTVISRYHRLLYAPASDSERIRQEIRELDAAGGTLEGDEGAATTLTPGEPPVDDEERYGRFDAGLRSESAVEYVRQGAVIRDARILDPRGEPVNVLRAGQTYTYAYEVDFDATAFMVRFGMMIKLASGLDLAGQASHRPGDAIELVDAGTAASVRFRFQAALLPGTYFLNAGVRARQDGAEIYLHRILDAALFRIEPTERTRITGRVDLSGSDPDGFQVQLRPATPSGRRTAQRP